MARPRKIIPDTIGINMIELASKILSMGDDAKIGAWLRKAVYDCINGCQDPNCDLFIKEQYENTVVEIRNKQNYDADRYQRRKALKSDNTLVGAVPKRENGLDKSPVSLSGDAPASNTIAKKPYGTCGHVMLTDAEGHTLRETYGNKLTIAIDILDAYAENNPKKFAKYKNHAAVLRKGNWVWNKVQEMILNEKRIENASKGPRNWKAEERERTARVLRGESADGKGYVRDDDLTPAELEAKYG